jgi:hypothetical protein
MQSFYFTFTSTKSHRQTDVTSILWETRRALSHVLSQDTPQKAVGVRFVYAMKPAVQHVSIDGSCRTLNACRASIG